MKKESKCSLFRAIFLPLSLIILVTAYSPALAATSGTHYPFGTEGVLAATVPPPGFHYRIYNSFYNPDKFRDDNGDELPIGFDLDVFVTVHRFVHVTKKKIFDADFMYDVVVPFADKEISIEAWGVEDSKSLTVGDITIEPFALAWHGPRYDAAAALALILPTGEFDADKPASPGLGYWSGMLTFGGTIYFNEQKSWSFSALTRTLVHTEQDDTEITPGSEFVVEAGLGKEIKLSDKLSVRPGMSGCGYWQISDDESDNPAYAEDERKTGYALGAEINFFWLPPKLFQLNLRALREFGAENNAEGSQFVITLTKSW
jgi:hypothetical protein